MLRRSIVAAACLLMTTLTLISCRNHSVNTPWSYDRSVGLAIVNSGHACLIIDNPSLAANTSAHVVDAQRQREISAVVGPRRPSCETGSNGMTGYEMTLDASVLQTPFVGIVVIGEGIAFVKRQTLVASDLDRDGHDEFFHACTSAEGVHATVWSDAALTGTRRWHRYYALGYDVEPNCTPAEVIP